MITPSTLCHANPLPISHGIPTAPLPPTFTLTVFSFSSFPHPSSAQRFLQQMAPRRSKKGLTRMDAALDQMSLMGFSKQHVRKTVKDLLQVYGGDEAWIVIEEDGYRVLLEVLLNEQETGESQNLLMDSSLQNENSGYELAVASSSEIAEPISSEKVTNRLLTNDTGTEDTECWEDIGLDKTCTKETGNCTIETEDHSASAASIQDSISPCLLGSPSDVVQTPNHVPLRKRKPCYGWISNVDEEESHFIILNPAI